MIRTQRLVLREWLPSDREPWAELNADPAVREFFPTVLTRAESDVAFERFSGGLADKGWGLWAVELDGVFVGFTGLAVPSFRDGVEIGWRFAAHAWGYGYATEAASAALDFGFTELDLPEIISFTAEGNMRSRRVMERLGMVHDVEGDFDHPGVEPGHALQRHVLYSLSR